jgi:hypothetical protein
MMGWREGGERTVEAGDRQGRVRGERGTLPARRRRAGKRDPGSGRVAWRPLLSARRGWFYDLRRWWDGLSGEALEELLGRAIPVSEVECAPLYRRPRKI